MDIARFGAWANNHVAQMKPEPKGDWVRFTDHQQTVERLERENECKDTLIETLQAQLAVQDEQINRLASFILREVPGEPSQSQGATETAARIIHGLQQQVAQLREEVTKAGKDYEACRDSLDRTVLAHTTLRGLVEALGVPERYVVSVDDHGGQIRLPDHYVLYSATSRSRTYALENLFDYIRNSKKATLPREGGM